MERMTLPEAIKRLEDLPTPASVADELVSMGIKARTACSDQCAIAEYFLLTTGMDCVVGIKDLHPLMDEPVGAFVNFGRAGGVTTLLSQKIGQFARNFDLGLYPKLISDVPGSGCPQCGGVNSYNCSVCNPTKD